MWKRTWWLCLVGFASLVAGAIFLVVYLGTERVNDANFMRIQAGMSEGEVESLFGRRADEQAPALESGVFFPADSDPFPELSKAWFNREGDGYIVLFDGQGKVCRKCVLPSESPNPNLLERFRRWFGR
jgi:hypothetical protein